ncbi:hypothetical protein SFRURICE_010430 [Spodoptera frugiperda]|nr:hypothetical protein SFRURICE_010430 [Spodoptera frugiperda]
MRNIRGSASYWQKSCSELVVTVRSLGPPTLYSWFMTFSCNDLNWPDMLQALLIADDRDHNEVDSLSFSERLDLVQRYPVVKSRQFTVRVNALMRCLKRDSNCLGGPVKDFWYRIEFQNRGSLHLHMLVWCKNIPDFATQEGVRLIEQVVSCLLHTKSPELNQLVRDVQTHKHTPTCYKNCDNHRCRFGFPRPVSTDTVCLGADEALNNNGRFCVLKRSSDETMVNNYNYFLLKSWKGNIDVQPCGNVTSVAYYVAKYASKCEPHDTGDTIREAIAKAKRQGSDVWKQLFYVSIAILGQRLVSALECAYRLCHLPLKMSSRKTVFVNSCKPRERFRLLRVDADETSIYNNIFDRYVLRPYELEDCMYVNVQWSEDDGDAELMNQDVTPTRYIKLIDNTRMRIRNRAAVLRTRYYTLNSDKEVYYYSLIVCHVPFRVESELLLVEETAEQPLQSNISAEDFAHAEQIIQQALAQAVALNAARDTRTDNDPLICGGKQMMNDDDNYCESENERTVMPDEVFLRNIHGLNIQQKDLFQKISAPIENDLQGRDDQFLMFITGGAGCGKSFVLKLLVEHIKRCYAPTVDIRYCSRLTLLKLDESREVATNGKSPPHNVIPKDVNNFGGLLKTVKLSVESRIMLRRNISVSEELVNGAMGIIKKKLNGLPSAETNWKKGSFQKLFKFDDHSIGRRLKDNNGCIAIPPVCATYQATRGYGDVERRMLPLILSWAVTVHKL